MRWVGHSGSHGKVEKCEYTEILLENQKGRRVYCFNVASHLDESPKEWIVAPLILYLSTHGIPRWGGLGCSNPPPCNSKGPPKSCQTQPDYEN